MDTINVQLPISLQHALEYCVKEDNTTLDQFVLSAIIEKVSALQTQNYLEERAAKGDKNAFRAVLDKVPSVPAQDYDAKS